MILRRAGNVKIIGINKIRRLICFFFFFLARKVGKHFPFPTISIELDSEEKPRTRVSIFVYGRLRLREFNRVHNKVSLKYCRAINALFYI